MKKHQPKQRPNQKAPEKQRRTARKLAEGRATREEARKTLREKAAKKAPPQNSELEGTLPNANVQNASSAAANNHTEKPEAKESELGVTEVQ